MEKISEFIRPSEKGNLKIATFKRGDVLAFGITSGDLPREGLIVRIQSPCLFGESFGINSCDCAAQLSESLKLGITQPGFLLVYQLDQEGRGLGMYKKIRAIEIEANQGVDMVEALRLLDFPLDIREYDLAADIIRELNYDKPIRLLTNNPKKINGLKERGIVIEKRLPLLIEPPNEACKKYLSSKKQKLGHILPHID